MSKLDSLHVTVADLFDRFCYERGLLQSVSALLTVAEEYCLLHVDEGGEVLLADIYAGLGSLDTESNQFQGAYDHFQKQWYYVQKALEKGELQRPIVWELFGLERLGNGLHSLHRYSEAEEYYRKMLESMGTSARRSKNLHHPFGYLFMASGEVERGRRDSGPDHQGSV